MSARFAWIFVTLTVLFFGPQLALDAIGRFIAAVPAKITATYAWWLSEVSSPVLGNLLLLALAGGVVAVLAVVVWLFGPLGLLKMAIDGLSAVLTVLVLYGFNAVVVNLLTSYLGNELAAKLAGLAVVALCLTPMLKAVVVRVVVQQHSRQAVNNFTSKRSPLASGFTPNLRARNAAFAQMLADKKEYRPNAVFADRYRSTDLTKETTTK